MQVEVTAAINLIAGSLYNKLPRRRVDAFAEELEKGIVSKFQSHWYPENPSKGAAYRCINVSGEKMDPVVIYAIMTSGLVIDEVNAYLPKELTIWIDPGEVSFSIGEKGQVKLLYSERRSANSSGDTTPSVSPPNTFSNKATTSSATVSPISFTDEMPSNLVNTFGGLNLSSSDTNTPMMPNSSWGVNPNPNPSPWPNSSSVTMANRNPWNGSGNQPKPASPWNQQPTPNFNNVNTQQQQPAFPVGTSTRSSNNNKTMTAAMFAQTKFGSTKLKTQAKRSNRLSPTENFQRSVPGQYSSCSQKGMNSNNNMSQSLLDRMQLHLQQNQMSDYPAEPFNDTFPITNRGDKSSRMPVQGPPNNNNGPAGRYPPFTLGSLTGLTSPSADQEWVDLSDLAVYPNGNHVLAT